MTDMVEKFETATLTLQQKQGRFNRNLEVFNVLEMLRRHGLKNLDGSGN